MKCFKGINLFSLVGIQPLSLKFVDIITKGQITFGISTVYSSSIKCKYYSRTQLKTDTQYIYIPLLSEYDIQVKYELDQWATCLHGPNCSVYDLPYM